MRAVHARWPRASARNRRRRRGRAVRFPLGARPRAGPPTAVRQRPRSRDLGSGRPPTRGRRSTPRKRNPPAGRGGASRALSNKAHCCRGARTRWAPHRAHWARPRDAAHRVETRYRSPIARRTSWRHARARGAGARNGREAGYLPDGPLPATASCSEAHAHRGHARWRGVSLRYCDPCASRVGGTTSRRTSPPGENKTARRGTGLPHDARPRMREEPPETAGPGQRPIVAPRSPHALRGLAHRQPRGILSRTPWTEGPPRALRPRCRSEGSAREVHRNSRAAHRRRARTRTARAGTTQDTTGRRPPPPPISLLRSPPRAGPSAHGASRAHRRPRTRGLRSERRRAPRRTERRPVEALAHSNGLALAAFEHRAWRRICRGARSTWVRTLACTARSVKAPTTPRRRERARAATRTAGRSQLSRPGAIHAPPREPSSTRVPAVPSIAVA
jgi:hypothetical protein